MNRAIVSGLTGALLALCAMSGEAAATEDGSAAISTSVLFAPTITFQDHSRRSHESSEQSSNETASREQEVMGPRGEKVSGSRASSQEITAGVSEQSRADSRAATRTSVENSNDSRAASVGTTKASASSHSAPRKLIVPWRARSEAASWLAARCEAAPSALLRSTLNGLRLRHASAGDVESSDRALAMELVAFPMNQG